MEAVCFAQWGEIICEGILLYSYENKNATSELISTNCAVHIQKRADIRWRSQWGEMFSKFLSLRNFVLIVDDCKLFPDKNILDKSH